MGLYENNKQLVIENYHEKERMDKFRCSFGIIVIVFCNVTSGFLSKYLFTKLFLSKSS